VNELYVIARRVLLDALVALGPHRDAVILVGAQAIYLHTGDAELAVAEYTTDADLALDPGLLQEIPPLERALQAAGFRHMGDQGVGVWKTRQQPNNAEEIDVQVDLLVPRTVSPGRGRRAARLLGHDPLAARIVDGLEGALVDQQEMVVASLERERDSRRIATKVAGPAALLTAKLFKINERDETSRAEDKDALDVMRLLQATQTTALVDGIRRIERDERFTRTVERATELLDDLFGTRGGTGALMAARACHPIMDETQVRLICEALAGDLLTALRS